MDASWEYARVKKLLRDFFKQPIEFGSVMLEEERIKRDVCAKSGLMIKRQNWATVLDHLSYSFDLQVVHTLDSIDRYLSSQL